MSSLAFIPFIILCSVASICMVVRLIADVRGKPRPRVRPAVRARPTLVVIQGGGKPKPLEDALPESKIA